MATLNSDTCATPSNLACFCYSGEDAKLPKLVETSNPGRASSHPEIMLPNVMPSLPGPDVADIMLIGLLVTVHRARVFRRPLSFCCDGICRLTLKFHACRARLLRQRREASW